jgi:hypothetical protein
MLKFEPAQYGNGFPRLSKLALLVSVDSGKVPIKCVSGCGDLERGKIMKTRLITALIAIALSSFAGAASADIVTVTFTGTVAPYIFTYEATFGSVIDQLGMFGTPGANLTGMPFISTWQFHVPCTNCQQGPNYVLQNGTVSPLIDATLTINGNSFDYGSGIFSELVENDMEHPNIGNSIFALMDSSYAFGMSFNLDDLSNSVPGNLNQSFSSNTTNPSLLTDSTFDLTGNSGTGFLYINTVSLQYVPGPMVGTGLPGLLAVGAGLLGLSRRRQKTA